MKEENRKTEFAAKMQRLFRKRWFFPALYLGLAAIIMTTVIWLQTGNNVALPEEEEERTAHDYNEEAVPTVSEQEVLIEPVLSDQIEIKTPFYDVNASAENQEAALVFYNNKYYQNKGIDYALADGETFDVVAALSGKVVKAEKDALLGHVVEIEHNDGVTTIYQSLEDVRVEAGDTVEQKDVLGKAGRNSFNQEIGIHAHFEIRKDGEAINPLDHFGKSVTTLTESLQKASEQQAEEQASEEKQADEATDEQATDEQADDAADEQANQGSSRPKDASSALTNA